MSGPTSRDGAQPSLGRVGGAYGADPQIEAVRRLRLLTVAASVAPAVAVLVMLALSPKGSPIHEARGLTVTVMCTLVGLSLVVRHLLGRADLGVGLRLDIGFGYEVVLAFLVATLRHSFPWAPGDGFREVSPVAIVILLFAALIPNPPRRTLLASMSAALMEPAALGVAVARGLPAPTWAQVAAIAFGPIAVAVAATFVSQVVYGLVKSVDAARRMGSYRLVERLGKGGMGEVWKAEHDLLARPAAIKLIEPAKDQGGADVVRFEREAQATALLRSPHTIQVYDFGVSQEGTFYYVMELIEGVDLERLVRDEGPLPQARVLHLLRQVCKSLDEAHDRGLCHRDIKPANLLVSVYGRERDFVKVLDFGLVKAAAEPGLAEPGAPLTKANAVLGTPPYMAPEMVLTGTVDARADLYALGCVAFWLLTGRLVFLGETPLKVLLQHVHDPPPPASAHAPGPVDPGLDRLILDCLAKDPAERPASAEVIEARIRALQEDHPWTPEDAERWWRDRRRSSARSLETAPTEIGP